MISILEVITLDSGARTEVMRHIRRLEAPSWSPMEEWLLVNGSGSLWRVELGNPGLSEIETGAAVQCNNDHGFTRDGRILFGSHHEGRGAQIYAIPVGGSDQPETISPQPPSWWHGISPDGKILCYAGVRGGPGASLDIFTKPLSGGAEMRLTQGPAHDDGPDFSHDGKWIYWNSDATGHAQIWRMRPDGGDKHPLFTDRRVNWFPHPSPCGRYLAWISYAPGTIGHPRDQKVRLMCSDPEGKNQRILAEFIGGQGSLNVPSWSPRGNRLAFIRYSDEPAEEFA